MLHRFYILGDTDRLFPAPIRQRREQGNWVDALKTEAQTVRSA